MNKKLFAVLNGTEINEYILKNEYLEAHILNYGGILKNLIFNNTEVVCGFDTLEDYIKDTSYQGALIGRYANRIRGAEFTLNGKKYKIGANQNKNHIHGGIEGFNRKIWNVENVTDTSITLSLFSPDGDEGFPGNLKVFAKYELCGSAISVSYEGKADADTVLNMTSHGYFNLNGCGNGTILSHKIKINANQYSVTDDEGIPIGRSSVDGTAFDLRSFTEIGKWMGEDFSGYDHNFVIKGLPNENIAGFSLPKIAEATNGLISMSVYSDQSGVQFYIGTGLEGLPLFRGNAERVNYGAFCLETQFEPDSPNHNEAFLRKEDTYHHTVVYKFEK